MGMFRIADNPELEATIKRMADTEERSEAKLREILLREAVAARGNDWADAAAYSIGVDHAKPGSDRTVVIKPRAMGKTALAKKIVEQAQKKKKAPREIEAVVSCPHGYAVGNCKKEDCNRKYRG